MRKVTIFMLTGLFMFMSGVYLSTLLSTHWVVVGTSLAIIGGFMMGGSSYFLPKIKKQHILYAIKEGLSRTR
ncbi:hypothetical protein [Rossellomorea aquimaris]|uniref:hypothetical protein n=2 Tax=Rossellomorea aquimaris TaxID=189382 RepID=UPI002494F108|nr:hypothetical protein [Rossellomorea aquimaris]